MEDSTNTEPAPWLKTSLKKREAQRAAIAPFRTIQPSTEADAITSINDISTLAREISTGKLKAYDVTLAYIQRAIMAHDKTNCLTGMQQCWNPDRIIPDDAEILFERAVRRAKALDDYLATHGKHIGSFHGVPMTLKDQFNVKGYDTTLGYVGRAFQPADDDADLVKILEDAGVIFLAKTNLPQSIMWCETENMLWGRTSHPRNLELTPGGSTGGETALLALHGSPLGWGTDIGGSVRIPAHMTGVYGFKPSSGRIPYEGVPVSTEGQEHVPSSVGPMARSLGSIQSVVKLIIDQKPWNDDPRVHRLPWNQQEYESMQTRPLTIGLLLDDGVVKVHPPVERIVRSVAKKLAAAGHTMVPWSSEGHAETIRVMDLYYTADGGEDIKRDIAASGEPYVPHVQALVNRGEAISVYEYWQLNRQKRAAQKAYLKKWQSIRSPENKEVDVLLMPVMPHVAVKHRHCKWVGYTKVWNLLDYTALVLPGGQVDRNVDPPKSSPDVLGYQPRNDLDRWNWDLYDPTLMDGMPIGVQVVGRRLEEEKVLGAGKVIDEILRKDQ